MENSSNHAFGNEGLGNNFDSSSLDSREWKGFFVGAQVAINHKMANTRRIDALILANQPIANIPRANGRHVLLRGITGLKNNSDMQTGRDDPKLKIDKCSVIRVSFDLQRDSSVF